MKDKYQNQHRPSQPNYTNSDDFSFRTDPNYIRQFTSDNIYDDFNNTDWDKESNYHNSYRVNGKNIANRTIKSKNWDKIASKAMAKRANEPKETILNKNSNPADWKLSDIGKEYYSKEIELIKTLTK